MKSPSSLRPDLPFRRLAVVMSGGGALGAYEVGVLRVLEATGLEPAILAGTSAGAINAAVWLAHGFDVGALEKTWRELRSESVGMRWTTLAIRAGGVVLAAYALIQIVLTLLGSPELGIVRRVWPTMAHEALSALLDALAWLIVAVLGALLVRLSRTAEGWLAALHRPSDPTRGSRRLGRGLIALTALHLVMWGLGLPWPHRFSATVLAAGAVAWLAIRPGRPRDVLRRLLGQLLPETRGRGLWGSAARRRLLEELVARGHPSRLTQSATLLIVNALALDSGRIMHFAAGPAPGPEFEARLRSALDEVMWLRQPSQVIEAVVASSAIPLAFEPVKIAGREFVDAGQFSNQPLEGAIAAGADALVVVLMAPSAGPPPERRDANLVELGARLLEVASWRQLHIELGALPPGWGKPRGGPAPVCVVEPQGPLPGGLLAFDRRVTEELMRRGERDAWRALACAGWLAEGAAAAPPA